MMTSCCGSVVVNGIIAARTVSSKSVVLVQQQRRAAAAAAAAAKFSSNLRNTSFINVGSINNQKIGKSTEVASLSSTSAAADTAAAAAAAASSSSSTSGYLAQKRAAKERRRELYEAKQERKKRIQTRRKPQHERDEKRREFRKFFVRKKVDEEYMERKARQAGLDWKLQVAVILERPYVVLPDKEDWEVEYENLSTFLMQFGKMHPKELYNVDYNAKLAITDEELLELLPKGYKPAPRETEADATGNVRTTDRKLKTSVYLTVLERPQGNDGDGSSSITPLWQMPTVDLEDGETLLAAAQRAVPTKVGTDVEFWCPSNAPYAVDMVAFSPEEQQQRQKSGGFYGVKKFFVKIQYDEGSVSEKEMTVDDYAWLDRDEVVERVRNDQGDNMAKFYHYML